MGGIGIWQLLIVLAIVLVLFGAKRLRNLGGDLGGAVKGFREAMTESKDESDAASSDEKLEDKQGGHTFEGEVSKEKKDKV